MFLSVQRYACRSSVTGNAVGALSQMDEEAKRVCRLATEETSRELPADVEIRDLLGVCGQL